MRYEKRELIENQTIIDKDLMDGIQDGIVNAHHIIMPDETMYYAACGDSITHANHKGVTEIAETDEFYPIDHTQGTANWNRKNYAYYIAKRNGLKWANYGYGGTTLHSCHPKGHEAAGSARTVPFVEDRINQLKADIDWDYISIFFGYNDVTYGPYQQKDFWLTETYGTELGYPISTAQIGAAGFADAEQKAACDAATGTVGGVAYDNADDYFFAKFIGTLDDTETTTFLGAYNYALKYLLTKYRKCKILIVIPYIGGTVTTRTLMRDSMKALAKKWMVSYIDFNDIPYWFYSIERTKGYTGYKAVTFLNPDSEDGRWYCSNGTTSYAGTVEGYNHAKFTADGTHPNNLGYITISGPIEKALLNS